jgi:hypothetical protein
MIDPDLIAVAKAGLPESQIQRMVIAREPARYNSARYRDVVSVRQPATGKGGGPNPWSR